MTEWKPNDRALLPVVVEKVTDAGYVRIRWTTNLPTIERAGWTRPDDLIPDDRRPSWLPGQPGDVAEFEGQRWACLVEDGDPAWICLTGEYADMTDNRADDDVPAGAVLILPAKTREATE